MNRSEQRLYLDRHMFDHYCCPEVEHDVEDYGEYEDQVDDREYEPCADYDE